eukprot:450075-Pleurochrysis_carterae.AAC.13
MPRMPFPVPRRYFVVAHERAEHGNFVCQSQKYHVRAIAFYDFYLAKHFEALVLDECFPCVYASSNQFCCLHTVGGGFDVEDVEALAGSFKSNETLASIDFTNMHGYQNADVCPPPAATRSATRATWRWRSRYGATRVSPASIFYVRTTVTMPVHGAHRALCDQRVPTSAAKLARRWRRCSEAMELSRAWSSQVTWLPRYFCRAAGALTLSSAKAVCGLIFAIHETCPLRSLHSGCREFGGDGKKVLCEAIKCNQTLRSFSLEGNFLLPSILVSPLVY